LAGIRIPMFVKIRLLNTVDETIELVSAPHPTHSVHIAVCELHVSRVFCYCDLQLQVRQLHEVGAALVAIHGRYRVNLVRHTPQLTDTHLAYLASPHDFSHCWRG